VNALGLHFALTLVYILVGDFEHLVLFYGLVAWIFFFTTVLGLIVLRARQPKLERPYRTWLSTPIVFCCAALFIIFRVLFEATVEAAIGFGFILIGAIIFLTRYLFSDRQVSSGNNARSSLSWRDFLSQPIEAIKALFARSRGNDYRAI
jgi:amino acid transporter